MNNEPPIIIGAGLAGLLAARLLNSRSPIVHERQASLPNNHAAVLRFRSDVVAMATRIPFRKVHALKHVHNARNPVADAIAYSLKVMGRAEPRSVISVAPSDRWVAPKDFIPRLAQGLHIQFGSEAEDLIGSAARLAQFGEVPAQPIISTIPMPTLMDILRYEGPRPNFEYRRGWTVKAMLHPDLAADVYATIYFPHVMVNRDRCCEIYRASITGDELMVEGVGSPPQYQTTAIFAVMAAFGFDSYSNFIDEDSVTVKESTYQKLGELDWAHRERAKRFILWASEHHHVFSLGRFATWRPKLLLDDCVNDIRIIERLIDGAIAYKV